MDNSIKASWKFQIHEQTMGEAWYIRKKNYLLNYGHRIIKETSCKMNRLYFETNYGINISKYGKIDVHPGTRGL